MPLAPQSPRLSAAAAPAVSTGEASVPKRKEKRQRRQREEPVEEAVPDESEIKEQTRKKKRPVPDDSQDRGTSATNAVQDADKMPELKKAKKSKSKEMEQTCAEVQAEVAPEAMPAGGKPSSSADEYRRQCQIH